jgi:arginyl-tRNA synthetase
MKEVINMTLKEYLEKEKVTNYVVTDRVRTPIGVDTLKYIDFSVVNVTSTEFKYNKIYIYTDYAPDAC